MRAAVFEKIRRQVLAVSALILCGLLGNLLPPLAPTLWRTSTSSTFSDSDWSHEVSSDSSLELSEGVTPRQLCGQDPALTKFTFINADYLENPERPRLKKTHWYWFIIYIFGAFYMFIALAIVCDEFFVPALEAFVDAFGISMDVAGATFMAAGGSMPELFTAFISTFKNDPGVGMATIVGSAVFNVLFVIAVCAVASEEVLQLTWWPLARDCSFYILTLMTLVFVFKGPVKSDTGFGTIQWWEALILLSEYIGYCIFMRFNGPVQAFFEAKMASRQVRQAPEDGCNGDDPALQPKKSQSNVHFSHPSAFRKGIVQLLTQNAYLYETAGIAAVTQIQGDLENTFKKLDKDGDGMLSTPEIKDLLMELGCNKDNAAIATALRRITRSGEEKISFDMFRKWYAASEARIEIEIRRVFESFDADGNGTIEKHEIASVLKSLGHKPTEKEINELMEELRTSATDATDAADSTETAKATHVETAASNAETRIEFKQFEAWYSKSMFYKGKLEQRQHEGEEEDGSLSLEMPESPYTKSAMFWYVLSYPLCALLYCCLPDVRRPKWAKSTKIINFGCFKCGEMLVIAIIEFILSLGFIGFFNLALYEFIEICSNTLRIPVEVAGITILAAGTSVTDLMSSYIVAKHGEGDMAVSSSIGSNIFDVTVGLPLPWLIYCFAFSGDDGLAKVEVSDKGIGFSVVILMLMLAAVILTIVCMKWRMTKALGYVMMLLYVVFITQALVVSFNPAVQAAVDF